MTELTPEQVRESIKAKSDQMNYTDLMAGPVTLTVAGSYEGSGEQPWNLKMKEMTDRVYRPSKGMRRFISNIWGSDPVKWKGHMLTLYGAPEVTWAGAPVGGIKISHMDGITEPVTLPLTLAKNKKTLHTVYPLVLPAGQGGMAQGDAAAPATTAKPPRAMTIPVTDPVSGITTTCATTTAWKFAMGDLLNSEGIDPGALRDRNLETIEKLLKYKDGNADAQAVLDGIAAAELADSDKLMPIG